MNNALIFDWIKLVTSYADEKIIRANQNGPKPADPFVTWQIVSAIPADFSDHDGLPATANPADYDVEYTDTRRYAIGVDINVYGSNGLNTLAALTQSNADPDVQAIFKDDGSTLLGSATVQDLTGLGDTKFVPRYQAEFLFNSFLVLTKTHDDYRWDDYSVTGEIDGDTITIEP
jgi:hypothetical protein